VFISTVVGGTEYIEPVVDIWLYVGNDRAFVEAVKNMIEARLKGTG
jgi:hypothetical protein